MTNQTVFTAQSEVMQTSLAKINPKKERQYLLADSTLPEILFITSYPPRECGIATYSQDLLKALDNKFRDSFSLKVCALESGKSNYAYPDEVKYVLDTHQSSKYVELKDAINNDKQIKLVLIQHEFGLYEQKGEVNFLQFLYSISQPIALVFHTVLPKPDTALKVKVRHIVAVCASIIVMTKDSAKILTDDYGISPDNIVVIEHGTHLVPHLNKETLKEKYGLAGRKVLSTFGLISSGKSIETTLNALPAIIENNPDILFLVIGKTHSGVVESEGERYRDMLEEKVAELQLHQHIKFINRYLPLHDLLAFLQLNQCRLIASDDELFDVVLQIAQGELEKPEIAVLLERWLQTI